jgi:mitogen-activated protein kinase 1/3
MVKLCDFGLARSLSGFGQLTKEGEKEKAQAAASFAGAANEADGAGGGAGIVPRKKIQRQLTKHVITRWYRPPEVIFCDQRYTWEVDIWSIGCIFAEMLSMQKESVENYRHRQPLFPGRSCYPFSPGPQGRSPLPQDRQDQLNVIMDVLGTMAEEDIADVEDKHVQVVYCV